jgi:predicted exporter
MRWNFFSLASILLIPPHRDGLQHPHSTRSASPQRPAPSRHAHHCRPIALCGLSTIAGFGSLGIASNRGLASLGTACALGILLNFLLTLLVLRHPWRRLALR